MKTLFLLVSFILLLNSSLSGKIGYTGIYTGATSDGWDMWFDIWTNDRAGFLRCNLDTGEFKFEQPILDDDGSFDFQNLTLRYTGTITEESFQGQITQLGKPAISFSGTRKPDFGAYKAMSGAYVGTIFKGPEGIEFLTLLIAADGEVGVFYTLDPNLASGTVGKGQMTSESTFVFTEASGITRTANFTLIDHMQISGSLESTFTTYGFVAYNNRLATHMVNISTRGFVGAGDNVMIAGFIIGPGGKTVLIRGTGPPFLPVASQMPYRTL
ncbi:MAG: hypothetical protein O3C20_14045 [Verrucomicrobia bacterium]|nr:hypothetical protein [Verrucomicrobiota bacterium]